MLWIRVIFLISALAVTIYSWHHAHRDAVAQQQITFQNLANENEDALNYRIDSYTAGLLGGLGFFRGSSYVSINEWRAYTRALDLQKNFPGINGIGYIENVPEDKLEQFEKTVRKDEYENFTIHPRGRFPVNNIIKYIEPYNINKEAIGLNTGFEANRREAARLATDNAQPAITKRILLVQDNTKSPGFLLMLPYYRDKAPLDTLDDRRSARIGWIYAPFVGKNFLNDLTTAQGDMIHVSVYDGRHPDEDNLIYSSRPKNTQDGIGALRLQKTITIKQQPWTLVWESTPAFMKSTRSNEPLLILFGGLFTTALFALLIILLTGQTKRVQERVNRRTRELKERELQASLLKETVLLASETSDENAFYRSILKKICTGLGWDIGHIYFFDPNEQLLIPGDSWYINKERSAPYDNFINLTKETRLALEEGLIGQTYSQQKPTYISDTLTNEMYFQRVKDGSFPFHSAIALPVFVKKRVIAVMEFYSEETIDDSSVDMEFLETLSLQISRAAEKILSDKQLRLSEERLSLAVTGSNDGLWDWNVESGEVYYSPSFMTLLGYEADELPSTIDTFKTLLHPDDVEKTYIAIEEHFNRVTEKYEDEYRLRHKNGEYLWCEARGQAVWDSSGKPVRMTGFTSDITHRKQVDIMKNEFISTVSHELRTPLTSIRGSLGLVKGGAAGAISDKAKDMIAIAYSNCERLVLLINDILDIEKIASGQMRFDLQKENLMALAEEAVAANKGFADKHEIEFVIEADAPSYPVYVDASRINQVLTNLLSNAVKYSRPKQQVLVKLETKKSTVRLSVVDHGEGIPEDFKDSIFGKFAQADSSSTRQKSGTGLGLHISQQIIEAMNGSIGFESKLGEGSTFWFDLSLTNTLHLGDPENILDQLPPAEEDLPLILLAEDNKDFVNVLCFLLRGKAVVHNVVNVATAAMLLKKNEYDLLIIDVELPDGSGLNLLEDLANAKGEPTKAMILSAQEVSAEESRNAEIALVKSRATENEILKVILSLVNAG